MERHFFHTYEVRYDECNLYGFVPPAAALNYLQDIAGLDASAGNLLEESGTWVARRTVLEFKATIPARARLEVETYPLGFSKVTAWRGYTVRLLNPADGTKSEPVLKGRTLWVYLDQRGRPARMPPGYMAVWLPDGPVAMPEETPWPPLPPTPPFITTAPVRFSDLDILAHVNNAAYVRLMDDAAWEAFAAKDLLPDSGRGYPVPQFYDIEYLESARAGDSLEIQSWLQSAPAEAENYERWQQVYRAGRLIVRAHSRWGWQT